MDNNKEEEGGGRDTEPPAEKSRSVGRYRRAFRYPSHQQKKVGLWVGTVVPLGTPRAPGSAITTVAVPRYLEVPIFLKSQQVWIITRRRRREGGRDTATEPPSESHRQKKVGLWVGTVGPLGTPPCAGFREHDSGGTYVPRGTYLFEKSTSLDNNKEEG